ncbi:MAG TPA: hypothetical protein VGE13_00220 [Candidatus Saccharimonadales bacterium]
MQPNEPQTPNQAPTGFDQPQAYTPQVPTQPQQPVQPTVQSPVDPVVQPAPFVAPTQSQSEPVATEPQWQQEAPAAKTESMTADEYENDDTDVDGPTELPEIQPINWQAQEYLQYDKSPAWYIVFGVIVCSLVGIAIFLQAWTFVALIPVMAVALVVYAHRPPHVVNYAFSEKGLYINDMLHPMGEFKTFSVVQSANPEQNQLVLIPVKRFRPSMTIFFPSSIGEQLVDIVGAYLPSQPYKPDAVDKIIQKLHI